MAIEDMDSSDWSYTAGNREQTISELMSGSYRMSRQDAEEYADILINSGGSMAERFSPRAIELLDKYDPGRGYDSQFLARVMPYVGGAAALAIGAGAMGAFGAGAGAGAGAGEVAAGGAMDMAGSAGVGSGLGGAGTASAAELAAAGGGLAGTGTTVGGSAPYLAPEALGPGTALAPVSEGLTVGQGLSAASAAASAANALSDAPGTGIDAPYPPPAGTNPPIGSALPQGSAGYNTALSRIIDGTATTADWISVLGTAGATGLGMFSANQQSNALADLQNQMRADRLPYLQASQGWLANPQSYAEGPGQSFMDATLRGLSARHGNPISSPTALSLATQAGMQDWRNAVSGMGSLGLGGQGIQADLGAGAARSQADIWGNLAGGISDVVNPRRSLADLMRDYSLMVGGARV